jgi:pimeloyl-ACP methyl ester carboxylesterase
MPDLRWTTSRVELAVLPGSQPVVAVHDPGSEPADRRRWLASAQQAWGAWVYTQRGHAPSGWVAGGVYRASDFAIDLIRLLRDLVAEPCLLVGEGAGGLVAVLAAAAAPGLVNGVHLLPSCSTSGWGTDPARVIGDASVLNRSWLAAAVSASAPASGDRDDPLLACGPAEKLHRPAVCAAAAQVSMPWSVQGRHFLVPCLPAPMQAAAPLVVPAAPQHGLPAADLQSKSNRPIGTGGAQCCSL